MVWFDELSLPGFTVEGRFGWVTNDSADGDTQPDLRLATGKITFTPTAPAVRVAGAWVGLSPVIAEIVAGGIAADEFGTPMRLLSTDADTGVSGWGWKARIDITGAKIPELAFRGPADTIVNLTGSYIPLTGLPVEVISVPSGGGGGTVDLSAYATKASVQSSVSSLQNAVNGKVAGLNGATGLWIGTQAQYDALTPAAGVVYIVQEA